MCFTFGFLCTSLEELINKGNKTGIISAIAQQD